MKSSLLFVLTVAAACSSDRSLEPDASVPPGPDRPNGDMMIDASTPPHLRRVFVTRTAYDGDFAGLAGADAACAQAAAAGGLAGTFVAYLSVEGIPAIDRLVGAGPWYRTGDDAKVFDDVLHVGSGLLHVPIDRDERGNRLGVGDAASVWTGTILTSVAKTCTNWRSNVLDVGVTGTIGSAIHTGDGWSSDGELSCATGARLYCFEQ